MRLVLASLAAVSVAGCGAAAHPAPSTADVLVGPVTRAEIEAASPAWRQAAAAASVDEESARALASVAPGAEIEVFLGTWCGDSRREVARFFRALEQVPEPRPFAVRLLGVARDKTAPGYTEGVGLLYVPTFVVRRDGAEIGRIVESAPRGVERELLGLLRGESHGLITGRTDLR